MASPHASTLEILDRLIACPTVSANSNLDLIDYVQDFLQSRGFAIHRTSDATGQKAGLFAALGPPGAGVMLSAHTDVVPVAGQDWTRDPFRLTRAGDRLYGRGTTDMKGYLAAMLCAADRVATRATTAPLREPLKLSISYDEEVGCVGIQRMIGDLHGAIGLPRAAYVGEPTAMQVAIGHKGKAALRATCHGEGGHSALAPRFPNALHLATDVVGELRQLQHHYATQGARDPAYDIPYTTLHVGMLHGGTALNIVPETAVIDFEYRHLAADDPDGVLDRILDATARVRAHHGATFPQARIDVDRYNAYPGLDVPHDAAFVTEAKSMAETNHTTKVAFGTEAGFFHALGIPTVVCGPGDMAGQGHKPDEYLTLDQLAACESMLFRIVDRLTAQG